MQTTEADSEKVLAGPRSRPPECSPQTRKRCDRTATAALCAIGLALLWFGGQFHDIEATETAERDRFVDKAQELRDGHLPEDPYRPLLYPILSAAAGELLDDTFAGARLVSQLSAIALLVATYLLGARCFGRPAGLVAIALLATNVFFIEHAVVTATDMLFAAFLAWTVLALVMAHRDPRPSRVLLVSGLFALSFFTRYAALGLLPCLLIGLGVSPLGAKHGLRRLALFAVATVVFLVPHFVLTERVFSDPFHHANIDNLLQKLYGTTDPDQGAAEPSLGDVASDPTPLVASALHQAREFLGFDFGFLSGNKSKLLGPLYTGLLLLGLYASLASFRRSRGLVLLAFVGSLALVFFSKLGMTRTLLPTLPLAYLFMAHFLVSIRLPGPSTFRGRELASGTALTVALVGLQVGALVKPLGDFVDRHPYAEIAAAHRLERECGSSIRVAGTFAVTDRYTEFEFHHLRRPMTGETDAEYHAFLEEFLRERDVEFLLVGRVSLRERPEELWTGIGGPVSIEVYRRDADVVVYRLSSPATGHAPRPVDVARPD